MTINELVGTYSVNYGHGSEKLVLNGDSTFTQVYTQAANGLSTTNSGRWEWWKEDGAILFRDVDLFDDLGGKGDHIT